MGYKAGYRVSRGPHRSRHYAGMYTAMKHSLLNFVVHRQEHWEHMDIEPGAA